MEEKRTPAQEQYWQMKKKHQDAILFFRMGDFYEMFGEDAQLASKILGLTLTSRDKSSKNPVPMAGVPYHAANKYIAQLTKRGYKIALCEQISDASLPGIVEREVVRVITPGTVVEDEMLESKQHNYLVCIAEKNNLFGLSFLDASTGDFFVTELASVTRLKDELFQLMPSEIIFPKNVFVSVDLIDLVQKHFRSSVSYLELFEDVEDVLLQHFQIKTLRAFGVEEMKVGQIAAGYLLAYVKENEKASLAHIHKLQPLYLDRYMHLDETTIRNLELLFNNSDGKKEGSLLDVLDQTETSMGGRLLRLWLLKPLLEGKEIQYRQAGVAALVEHKHIREELRQKFKHVPDMERILAKIALRKSQPQDLLALAHTIALLPQLTELFKPTNCAVFSDMQSVFADPALQQVEQLIGEAIDEQARMLVPESKIIKQGYHAEIDDLKRIVYQGKDWLLRYQAEEQGRTGISTLKVAYNKVFGYYLEVSKGQAGKVPQDFMRKQTLVNAERFITPVLKEYEEKAVGAESRLWELERQEFHKVAEQVLGHAALLQDVAGHLSTLDVLLSFARVAVDRQYVQPEITNHKGVLRIQEGRHPVVEYLSQEPFVGNDLELSKEKRLVLLTGPNMAGKSTYLRQNALIILLAQIGSFVPAKSCILDPCDHIFTRIGAGDALVKGQSTFLVEMQETANILHNATERSFVILDEVGRGTSTYDGLSLAWSILEYLHQATKAKVLFATHYHELVQVAEDLPGAVNASMAVTENRDSVVFLRKVVPGGVDKSYGIEVAKISGLPAPVISRAKEVLGHLESLEEDNHESSPQLSFLQPQIIETVKMVRKDSEVEKKLAALNLDQLTPLDALNLLAEMKRKIGR